jgi:hypothetical protein
MMPDTERVARDDFNRSEGKSHGDGEEERREEVEVEG